MRMTTFMAAVGVVSGVVAASAAGQARPRTHTVVMEDMRFQPEVLAVASGDTVVCVNTHLGPHTATSTVGGFDSSVIPASGSWTHTVGKKGAFGYLCTFHPAMKGTLNVR
jgi:plastocyanin